MTKADLAAAVAGTGMTKKQAAAAVDAVIGAIKGSLAKGEEVRLIGATNCKRNAWIDFMQKLAICLGRSQIRDLTGIYRRFFLSHPTSSCL